MAYQFRTLLIPLISLPLALFPARAADDSGSLTLTVNAHENVHKIDPDIYGLAQYQLSQYSNGAQFAQEIDLPNIRWGGDATTRYNWEVDSTNAGGDFYFLGGSGVTNPTPSGQVDTMIETYKTAKPLITIPIIPYINSTSQSTCSYPVNTFQFTPTGGSPETIQGYGPQQSYMPFLIQPGNVQCGNGFTPSGDQLVDTNIYYNNTDNSPSLQQDWVQHLIDKFGTGSEHGIRYFQLDNEPYGWGNTHRDVQPDGVLYSTIVDLGEQYASAVKAVDPTALIFGPSDFTLGGWIGDTTQQDGLYAGQYYLKEFAEYDKQNRSRSLNYFDEHFYGPGGSNLAEIQSTRVLWDPTYNSGTWVEQYVFDGPMQLIPRFKSWISEYYPGTKLSLSEFSMTVGGTTIYDALTQADALGIFGRQGLDFANEWYVPDPGSPVAFSYRLYRNYDGHHGEFGDLSVESTSTDQTQLSIYGAYRRSDGAITLVVINKTANDLTAPVKLSHLEHPAKCAAVYSYSSANLTAIVRQPDLSPDRTADDEWTLKGTFPALSATEIIIPKSE